MMTAIEYIEKVKAHLMASVLVENFRIIRERTTETDGHLRAKLHLSNDFFIEFSEYVQVDLNRKIDVITYSYHCFDPSGNSIIRWDNAPHFPNLPGFPHHKHIGMDEKPEPSLPMNIFKVLSEINEYMQANRKE